MLGLHNIFLCSSNISSPVQRDRHGGGDNRKNDGVSDDGSVNSCRDCGNRAKKECSYWRCRTCCKSRGYNCATHERSTWIPASKRREKKETTVGGGDGSSGLSSCGVKRTRGVFDSSQNLSTAVAATPSNSFGFGTSWYHQEPRFKQSLPVQVEAPAVFRCIRVTAINDNEAEPAYVATVNISGHMFKGFLYDKGVNEKNLFPRIPSTHLESSTTERSRDSSSPGIDPSNV